jgi:hypothetical protein
MVIAVTTAQDLLNRIPRHVRRTFIIVPVSLSCEGSPSADNGGPTGLFTGSHVPRANLL